MKRLIALAILATAAGSAPALAVPGGTLDTLPLGDFVCELPGDADGPVGLRTPEYDFSVVNSSSYRTATGTGNYLLTGDRLILTSGPLRDEQFHRISERFLRRIEHDGSDGRVRCILRVANNRRGN